MLKLTLRKHAPEVSKTPILKLKFNFEFEVKISLWEKLTVNFMLKVK